MTEQEFCEVLGADNAALAEAGDKLAVAAARVCADYDGVHRLRLALTAWFKVRANESGRGAQKVERD